MNSALSSASSAKSRSTMLASLAISVWLAAAALTGPLGIWPAIGGAALVLGTAVLLCDRPAQTALLKPSLRLVLLGVMAGGFMVAATYLLYPVLTRLVPFIATDAAGLYAAFRTPSLVIAAAALVPVIACEELVWRGVVQGFFVRPLGAWRGVILTAFVYAMVHAPIGSPVLVVVAFFCGLAWGSLRVATASLVPTLVSHLLWDAFVLLWLPLG